MSDQVSSKAPTIAEYRKKYDEVKEQWMELKKMADQCNLAIDLSQFDIESSRLAEVYGSDVIYAAKDADEWVSSVC